MTLEQLVYTPEEKTTSGDRPSTMVLMVNEEMLKKYKKDKSIPLAEVVDSFDVLKYEMGSSGQLNRPSKAEIKEAFGTTNEDEIVQIMLNKGSLHGRPM